MPGSHAQLWAVHASSAAIRDLTPWFAFPRIEGNLSVENGAELSVTTGIWPLRTTWRARLLNVAPPHGFEDIALQSPFRVWRHRHQFLAVSDRESELVDEITYEASGVVRLLAPLGLRALFWYRHRKTAALVRRIQV